MLPSDLSSHQTAQRSDSIEEEEQQQEAGQRQGKLQQDYLEAKCQAET